jgi:hypothetical protein
MKRGRYNILLPNGEIKKYNVYQSAEGHAYQLWIYYEKEYVMIEKKERYRGGWLWKLKEREINE